MESGELLPPKCDQDHHISTIHSSTRGKSVKQKNMSQAICIFWGKKVSQKTTLQKNQPFPTKEGNHKLVPETFFFGFAGLSLPSPKLTARPWKWAFAFFGAKRFPKKLPSRKTSLSQPKRVITNWYLKHFFWICRFTKAGLSQLEFPLL